MSESLQPHELHAACQASVPFRISWNFLRLKSIELVMPSNHFILCRPFSSFPQSFLASGSFPMGWLFTSGGQNIGVYESVIPMNIQGSFPLGWTGWISLQSKGLLRVFSNTTVQSINSSALTHLYGPTLTSIHDYWKNHRFD